MYLYRCTIYNFDYTFGEYDDKGCMFFVPAERVAIATTWARGELEAAAKSYCRTVGRERVRILRKLNAPEVIIKLNRDWRTMAACLSLTTIWLGDCYFIDNKVESFYIRVESNFTVSPSLQWTNRLRRRWRLLLALRPPKPN
jgi:hypothetical protein